MQLRPISRWIHVGPFPPLMLLPGAPRRFSPSAGSGGASRAEDPGLHTFFEQSFDPLLVLDASHNILEANAAASRLLTTPHERLKGSSVLEVDVLARLLTAGSILQKLKTDPPPVVDEVTISDPEGQPIRCRIEAIPLKGGRVFLHLQNTTAMLRTLAAVQLADRLHHALFEALPEVAWRMALPEERLLEVSPAVERLFGYQPAAFREHPELWDELVHPADRERVRAEFRKGIGAGRPFEIHFTGLHRDHGDLPDLVNRVVPVMDERGWTDHCEGFIEDRSAAQEIEDALRRSEAHLRHVLDSVSSGVMVLAPGERGAEVMRCNRRLADMLRLDEPPKPGTPLSQAPEALREFARGPHGESDFERRLLSEDSDEKIAELKEPQRMLSRFSGPVRDPMGAVVGRIITVEDVTATWTLHRRLTHAQKMESMGRLAGGVAHDFNNLLGSMLGFGSLLLEQTGEDDPRRAALHQIVEAAERASRLTAALLAFSRSARFERLPVDLNKVIEESYQLIRSGLDPSISFEIKPDPALPRLVGDALLLQQIVINLAQAARERLGTGGSLHVSTRIVEKQKLEEIPDTQPRVERMVALDVEVSGPSIGEPRQVIEAAPESVESESPGFALTIAEDIARAHGGYLVTGAEAAPALFRVLLPVNAPEEAPPIVPETATAHGHETILVVDDEPGLRVLAKTGLQQRGFDVLTADSGEKALEILRAGEPAVDLVLLDLSMPGISGERVLRAIRGFRRELPVIIASGYATVESQAAWNAAGAQGFVAKPYRIQDVAVKLREVLDRAHGRVT